MDNTVLAIAGAIATPVSAGVAWLCKKAWKMYEDHAERRTKAMEAVAPAIKSTFDEMRKHVTDHADEQAKAVKQAEQNIVKAVDAAKADIVDKIGISTRLERLEVAAGLKAKDQEDPSAPERSESRPPRVPSPVLQMRESRPAAATR